MVLPSSIRIRQHFRDNENVESAERTMDTMNRYARFIAWPLVLGILGALSAKRNLPGGDPIVFLSVGFAWGAVIGFAIVGIATASRRSVRIAFWALGFSLLGLDLGTFDQELVRPILLAIGGAVIGLVVGFSTDGLVSRTAQASARAKVLATTIIVAIVALAVVYVGLNWLQN